ncbi:hypothetical protein AJ80_01534 [Polytolypa hystricis UAMH7299]|uniref:Uncharacterized protein n=1 Tax=Polytolypa hystricis (strain UAMH7299) TaxID=1447883 RepID=A0A2B7Z028_POLH7|nr:hypothetical protein AJ80_01534 [Polytolypa hystricis UAMH7299]
MVEQNDSAAGHIFDHPLSSLTDEPDADPSRDTTRHEEIESHPLPSMHPESSSGTHPSAAAVTDDAESSLLTDLQPSQEGTATIDSDHADTSNPLTTSNLVQQQVIQVSGISGSSLDQVSSWAEYPSLDTTVSPLPIPNTANSNGLILYSLADLASADEDDGDGLHGVSLPSLTADAGLLPTNTGDLTVGSAAYNPEAFVHEPENLVLDTNIDDSLSAASDGSNSISGSADDESMVAAGGAGSLIVSADLALFTQDRLPHGLHTDEAMDEVYDESLGDPNDMEKFYVSDDEFSLGDPIESDSVMSADPSRSGMYGQTLCEPAGFVPNTPLSPVAAISTPVNFSALLRQEEDLKRPEGDRRHEDSDEYELGYGDTSLKTGFSCSAPSHSSFFPPYSPSSIVFLAPKSSSFETVDQAIQDFLTGIDHSTANGLYKSFANKLLAGSFSVIFCNGSISSQIVKHLASIPTITSFCCNGTKYICAHSSEAAANAGCIAMLPSACTHRHNGFVQSDVPLTGSSLGFLDEDCQGSARDPERSSTPLADRGATTPEDISNGPLARLQAHLLTADEYDDLYSFCRHHNCYVSPSMILDNFSAPIASALLLTPPTPSGFDPASGFDSPAFEINLTVEQFIRFWLIRSRVPLSDMPPELLPRFRISEEAAYARDWPRPAKIMRPDNHQYKFHDIQNIPWWKKLGVTRSRARTLRDAIYSAHTNVRFTPHGYAKALPEREVYFKAKTMYTKYKATMSHFQLRNLMSVTTSNTIQYVHRSKVYSVAPFYDEQDCLINLSNGQSSMTFVEPVKISSMKAKHGVTVVGGFSGEYAMRGDLIDGNTTEGFITKRSNGISNHIDIVKHRTSGKPQAVISSNDLRIRILDCETNQFVQTYKFASAVNCTDTSPDGRLRVVVGDAPAAWVLDSETGKPIQCLSGHKDYGFACAWSPDMLHIATSNQDKTVNIWDARMWRIMQCIDSDVAGYRSLRYSPVGGGPRTLLMCEPADRIAIVNAQNYQTRQVHNFFGEIGGADYSPDGGRIWVANMDDKFGGLMEFDRWEWGQRFGLSHLQRTALEYNGDVYFPDLPNEWVPEDQLDDDPRCVLGAAQRRLRYQRFFRPSDMEPLIDI